LIEAKAGLEHGEWLAMIRKRLPSKESLAERLIKIAENPMLANRNSGRRAFERARADLSGAFEREVRPYPPRG
jgi:hypothetical protein